MHAVFGVVMGSALLSGCTNTVQHHIFPTPPEPYYTPAPAPEPPPAPIEKVNHVEENDDGGWTPMPPTPPKVVREDPSIFPTYKGIIQDTLPGVSRGSASAVRFMNYSTDKRYTTMTVSEDGFVPLTDVPGAGLAFMMNDDGERLAIVIGSLKPGHYDCGSSNFAIGFAFPGEAIDSEQASWSDRPGAYCSFDLWAGDNPGDIQGSFDGVLSTNDNHTLSIADGYFYARKPQVTQSWTPAPGPNPGPRPAPPKPYHR